MRYNIGDIVQLYHSRDNTYIIKSKYLDRGAEMYRISPLNDLNLEFNYICEWLNDNTNASLIQRGKSCSK